MASAGLAPQLPLRTRAPAARQSLLTLLGEFQQALNGQFDSCRYAARYRPSLALRRLRSGVELLCQLQQELLHPALREFRPVWPALAQAAQGVTSLRDLAALGTRSNDIQQQAIVSLLEGVAQLHFASLDELLAQADVTAIPWAELERAAENLLMNWHTEQSSRHVEVAESGVLHQA